MKKLKQKRQYKVYPCRICGSDMRGLSNPHKRRYCSEGCQVIHTESLREEFDCAICGLHVKRLRSRSSPGTKAKVCSLQCQAKWRNKLSPISTPKWDRRSEKAKDRYKKMSRRLRQQKYRPIIEAIGRFNAKNKARVKQGSWKIKIAQRLVYRPKAIARNSKTTKKDGVLGAVNRFYAKIKYKSIDPWKKKIANKLSNYRQRVRKKDEQAKGKHSHRNLRETRAKPVQMCFNWMEDHAR